MEEKEIKSGQQYRSTIMICLIAAAIGIYWYIQTEKQSTAVNTQSVTTAGQPAPDFALPLLNGEITRLSDHKGKIVFLNIWATWCRPCQEEMPSMEKLHQKLKGLDFEILAVSIDTNGAAAVKPFVKKLNLNFPILLDPEVKIGRLYNTTGVPETFIIDKNGIIISKIIGYKNWFDPEVIQTLTTLAESPTGNK